MIILGDEWFEFCEECADTPDVFLNNVTGEKLTPRQMFERLEGEQAGKEGE